MNVGGIMSDKRYVGMQICPVCRKESTGILLDRGLKDSLPRESLGIEPCDKCKDKYLKNGTMLINPETMDLKIIKDSAFKRIFNKDIPKKKIAFCEQGVLDFLVEK